MNLLKYIKQIDKIIEDVTASNGRALEHLQALRCMIVLDEATNNMSKTGRSRVKTLASLIKKCDRIPFQGVFEDGDKCCFCDGVIAFALNDKMKGVPEVAKPLNVVNIIDNIAHECTQAVTIDSAKLNELVTLNKARRKNEDIIPYKIILDNVKICFNPEYYKTMMDILGAGCKVYVNSTSARAPLYFTSDVGSGIMLPMICKEN